MRILKTPSIFPNAITFLTLPVLTLGFPLFRFPPAKACPSDTPAVLGTASTSRCPCYVQSLYLY